MPSPKNLKILAVDDTPDNLFLIETILSDLSGYEVSCVENGQAAINVVEQSPPDLILLDVMMPGINGYEVTRHIREALQLTSLPILLVTAHSDLNEAEGIAIGASGIVRKPYDVAQLVEQVEKALLR